MKPSDLAKIAAETYVADATWKTSDVHVISRDLEGYTVIAFRGTTKDGIDILRDLRAMPWWSRRVGFAPAGFLKGVRALLDETTFLVDVADALKAGKLIVTGHSLGGAMALICAAWLTSLGYKIAGVYAFEPARCGGFKMQRLWRQIAKVFWTRDGGDPVPDVPLLYALPDGEMRIGHAGLDALRCHRIGQVIGDLIAVGS